MQGQMLRLVYLAWPIILLIASLCFIHYGSSWKITVERTSVPWDLILLGNRRVPWDKLYYVSTVPGHLFVCFSLFDLFQFLGMVPSHHRLVELDWIGGAGGRRIFRCTNEFWILTQQLSSTGFEMAWNWVFCRGECEEMAVLEFVCWGNAASNHM